MAASLAGTVPGFVSADANGIAKQSNLAGTSTAPNRGGTGGRWHPPSRQHRARWKHVPLSGVLVAMWFAL